MSWLELSVAADQEAAESISEVLARYGYQGGVVVEALPPADTRPDEPGVPLPLSSDPAYPVVLRTYLPHDEQAAALREQIEQALWHLGRLRPVGPLTVRVLEEADWANAWKQYYAVQHIGSRTVIVPSWLDYTPQPAEIVLHLDPGMAFGTGLHPTTRLCLELLERYARPDVATLDLGTGSGILAIAAARQGAAPVLALDIDPVAVEAAQANSTRNGVAEQVQAGLVTDLARLGAGRFGLIAANIIADVLMDYAAELRALLAPGGILLSSGIILDREDEVALTYASQGLQQRERQREGEWIAFVHQAPEHAR